MSNDPDRASIIDDVAPIPRANAPAASIPDRDADDNASNKSTVTRARAGIGSGRPHEKNAMPHTPRTGSQPPIQPGRRGASVYASCVPRIVRT